MKQNFGYLWAEKTVFCYRGKNEVVELVFDTVEAAKNFVKVLEAYQTSGETKNKDLLNFLKEHPAYEKKDFLDPSLTILVLGGEDEKIKQVVTKSLNKRGFLNVSFDTSISHESSSVMGLNIKTKNKGFEKQTLYFLDQNIPFLTIDIDQGAYGVVGPFCFPKDLACPFCAEIRTHANNLLDDFHLLAKQQHKTIKEYFVDDIFIQKIIMEAVDELFFEAVFGRSNLRNFVRNYNFYTGSTSMEGVLPYPDCRCQQ